MVSGTAGSVALCFLAHAKAGLGDHCQDDFRLTLRRPPSSDVFMTPPVAPRQGSRTSCSATCAATSASSGGSTAVGSLSRQPPPPPPRRRSTPCTSRPGWSSSSISYPPPRPSAPSGSFSASPRAPCRSSATASASTTKTSEAPPVGSARASPPPRQGWRLRPCPSRPPPSPLRVHPPPAPLVAACAPHFQHVWTWRRTRLRAARSETTRTRSCWRICGCRWRRGRGRGPRL